MYTRHLEHYLSRIAHQYKSITLIGPRQSGKTTLARKFFDGFQYYNFENPDVRDMALYDPRQFLTGIQTSVILDEIQRVPDLLSYLQEILDDDADQRRFILTGSNNLRISEKVSQSLAGRTRLLEVLPFARSDFPRDLRSDDLDTVLFYGGYPRIYKEKLSPSQWLADYFATYVEKDVRSIINIENWVIAEYIKTYANNGRTAPLYFWRDQHGHEIDLVIDHGLNLELIEIKSGMTFNKDYFKQINWVNKLQNRQDGLCIYGGTLEISLGSQKVIPWKSLGMADIWDEAQGRIRFSSQLKP